MKYFTPERYLALQTGDEAAIHAADADWERAVDQYESYLQLIRPGLPESVRLLLEGFYLHDADVLCMGNCGEQFRIALQLDVPPNDLLFLTYTLAAAPEINREAFPADGPAHNTLWLYEEIEHVNTVHGNYFVHSVLLSNGWEVRVPFHEVALTTAASLLPLPHSTGNGTAYNDGQPVRIQS